MKTCLIMNGRAGSVAGLREAVDRFVDQAGWRLELSDGPDDTPRCVRAARDDGFDRLAIAGGDGTVSQVVNALAPDFDAVELAVLPLGTGNDLARSLGIGVDDFSEACAIAAGDRVERIDVVRLTNDSTSYFINSANGGFGGKVAVEVTQADKQRWGAFAYWLTAASELVQLDGYQARIELDDDVLEKSLFGIAVANGRYVGGGFAMAPGARLNDGLLHVTMIPVLPLIDLIGAGAWFAMGSTSDEGVTTSIARRVAVRSQPAMPFSVDGETTTERDAVFEILPRALRICVGENAELEHSAS